MQIDGRYAAMIPVSIVVLTHNEERDLPHLLSSLPWCDDSHVVDDGSTDGTVRIARDHGAKCYTNPFESFGKQRNWALENCCLKYPWVLFLDADEVSTPAFASALKVAVEHASSDVAGFYCCWKLILGGKWLRRCDAFPKWQLRLVRRGRAFFADFGHGQKEGEVNGRLGYITEPYLHYAFSKGWSFWLERHNRYSTQEAMARTQSEVIWREVFSREPSVRNKALKPLVGRLPGWPFIRFVIDYFGRLGFLEGRAGFIYCANMAIYEYFIRLKMAELRRASDSHKYFP